MHNVKNTWLKFKTSKHYHNVMMFLVFVVVSSCFWLIMTLNDNAQQDFDVKIVIEDVPDSVTFISDLPQSIHVNVRDKGSTLFRTGMLRTPELRLKFDQYAHNGMFRVTNADLASALHGIFGSQASISISDESLVSQYTTVPGKQVPLVLDLEATAAFNCSINAAPYAVSGNTVTVFAIQSVLDTITAVHTQKVVKHDLTESQTFSVPVVPISGARIIPDRIKVTVPVEPLVRKQTMVDIVPVNVPDGVNLKLFPSRVQVTYFAPMSQFDQDSENIVVKADYDLVASNNNHDYIQLKLDSYPERYINTKLVEDSVKYTIEKKE